LSLCHIQSRDWAEQYLFWLGTRRLDKLIIHLAYKSFNRIERLSHRSPNRNVDVNYLRFALSTLVIVVTITASAIPAARISSASGTSMGDSNYVLVGGQNGTWFKSGQAPRLEIVSSATKWSASCLVMFQPLLGHSSTRVFIFIC
jgi:hypothetical protein